jgi:hypothetical protein
MTMTTTCRTLSSSVRPAHLQEAPTAPSSYVIDFVAARDRLRTEIDEVSRQLEIEQEVRKAAAQRKRSIELYDPVEDWLYSLIPAAAIVALLVGVLGLLDSKTPGTQTTTDTKTSNTIEQTRWSQSKDGKF